jgi:hypothetical protein
VCSAFPAAVALVLLHLQEQEYNSLIRGRLPEQELQRPAIAVCHTFPDCYLLPKDKNGMDVPVSTSRSSSSSGGGFYSC